MPDSCKEVWVLVHGVNSNFYSSSLLTELAGSFRSAGFGVLLANTRGHDILSFNTGPSPMRVGSQIEVLANSVLDIEAWVGWLQQNAKCEISLLGHSLGALKCCLWALGNSERAKRWIAVSPPRINTALLMDDPKKGNAFREHLRDAMDLCASGNPEQVMKVRYPMPMWICASTYVDKYGSGERYDYIRMASQVRLPGLWTFGKLEVDSRSANFGNANVILSETISDHVVGVPVQTVRVVANADHSYRDARVGLLHCIHEWLR